jgi:hypothetical protein
MELSKLAQTIIDAFKAGEPLERCFEVENRWELMAHIARIDISGETLLAIQSQYEPEKDVFGAIAACIDLVIAGESDVATLILNVFADASALCGYILAANLKSHLGLDDDSSSDCSSEASMADVPTDAALEYEAREIRDAAMVFKWAIEHAGLNVYTLHLDSAGVGEDEALDLLQGLIDRSNDVLAPLVKSAAKTS